MSLPLAPLMRVLRLTTDLVLNKAPILYIGPVVAAMTDLRVFYEHGRVSSMAKLSRGSAQPVPYTHEPTESCWRIP